MLCLLITLWLSAILLCCGECHIKADISHGPIQCMNYYGLETERNGMVCDWKHEYHWYIDQLITNLQINTIRLPFSYQLFKSGNLELMDNVVRMFRDHGFRIILDWHRNSHDRQAVTPEEGIGRDEFINTWIQVLERYPCVWAVGIFNEIQIDDDSFEYTNQLHRQVITAIESHFPNKFYYLAGCPRWGGNCSGMDLSDMPTWNRTFIEVHKYIFSGNSVPSDWDQSIPRRIPPEHWIVGETGWKQSDDRERVWAEGFLRYLKNRGIFNVCVWTIAHSGDTEGWWHDDCETFNWDKASEITSFWECAHRNLRSQY